MEDEKENEMIIVCDKCFRACCIHGLFMCDEARYAGTTNKPRKELIALELEHPSYITNDEY